MVLHQVKNWQNWKMQGCFMQFLHLIFVKKLEGASPRDPIWGVAPWTPTGGLLQPPGPHFSADFSILNSHACEVFFCHLISHAVRSVENGSSNVALWPASTEQYRSSPTAGRNCAEENFSVLVYGSAYVVASSIPQALCTAVVILLRCFLC